MNKVIEYTLKIAIEPSGDPQDYDYYADLTNDQAKWESFILDQTKEYIDLYCPAIKQVIMELELIDET